MIRLCFPLLGALLLHGCGALIIPELPDSPPPLVDMEEPARLLQEPQDEDQRQELEPGSFSGLVVADARATLDAMLDAAPGLEVIEVITGSPAQQAGLEVGDLLLEADAGAGPVELVYPGDWRGLEVDLAPETSLRLLYDRAGVEFEVDLVLAPRVRPAERRSTRRFREEDRIGVVLRTATEVEARDAGLPPGGGAVVVGLDRRSPWRSEGIQFGDLIVSIDGREVVDPQVVLEVLRALPASGRPRLELRRDGELLVKQPRLSRRATQTREVYVPLLFSYEANPEQSSTSILLGLISHRRTRAAWRMRLLWLIRFGGGDTDQLIEVEG